ncbi:PIN domain-containing protein [Enterococcus faecium]|uniref:PIN domain-containing protein n=2 Tax=Enterococcus faecium TaxID=1352 RepID=UPI0002A23447|nr:PIN domain-containing protein [Enterococcus faecium]EGP5118038.1 hypothetical protein [Enterococcus faecium]ELB67019.1 hypothetical protein OKY_03019 [Enterococcus faecium EnGen0048]KAA9170835.1 hypothetical protein F6X81_07925 [Enterococcus faecium]KAA9200572.1 hypothetical protein F6X75_07825 [Enterococcus faecium]KAA9201374.1 hypothetical protein F6X82_07715 [Enterococcus faecium]
MMVMNVYIDSNIWLGLYHFWQDDLKEFEKLKNSTEINLFLPQQTRDEVDRNRLAKINDARKKFEDGTIVNTNSLPNLYKEFTEKTDKFNELSKEFNRFFNDWKKDVSAAVQNRELRADVIINELFDKSINYETEKFYEKAVYRMNIGNPPGKNKSYGDAINWESLLDIIPEGENLYLITDDIDYYDDKKTETVNSFLSEEWKAKKSSDLYMFNSLSSFFGKHLTHIQLIEEERKDLLVSSLRNSLSFNETHSLVNDLKIYQNSFSDHQVEKLVEAAVLNSQISWILEDEDVNAFYRELLKGKDIEITQVGLFNYYYEKYYEKDSAEEV